MKQLPPIFKVSNNIKDTNQKYYYEKVTNKIKPKEIKKTIDNNLSIEEKINKIFKTKGYAFNIPVEITFSNKTVNTYLALKRNDSIITLDNEVIPISTITSLEIKSPSE
ncbi:MAG TPA: hypothetical protein IAB38_00995 [Candidatus Onthousia excrementipullorum]|uniref:Uncharacterized protein n=1 Tax=Candidatus Onthousia excrementipullorum TaxID=2840884 RepID=A0A9D1DT35_9FIRM|nr:hypothetical protein [Candidatus Onthousia excrementipullorum]